MVNVNETFATLEAAERFRADYIALWHPCGYGTTLWIVEHPDGRITVTGWRYRPCD